MRDFQRAGSDYEVVMREEPYLAEIRSADFDGAPDLTFDGYGVLQSSGTLVICSGNQERTITIDSTKDLQDGLVIDKKGVVAK